MNKDKQIRDLKEALELLVQCKEHKEEKGKDQAYNNLKPIAWQRAKDVLKSLSEDSKKPVIALELQHLIK